MYRTRILEWSIEAALYCFYSSTLSSIMYIFRLPKVRFQFSPMFIWDLVHDTFLRVVHHGNWILSLAFTEQSIRQNKMSVIKNQIATWVLTFERANKMAVSRIIYVC